MLAWGQVVGKIYDGKVASVLDFGAFVGLEGVEGRREGLVHVSAMSSDRVLNPRSFVEKGQRVKVRYSAVQCSAVRACCRINSTP
jgi:ATP-dependent RNA helicase DHX8/PRP22